MAESNGSRGPHDVARYVDRTAASIKDSLKLLSKVHDNNVFEIEFLTRMREAIADARRALRESDEVLHSTHSSNGHGRPPTRSR